MVSAVGFREAYKRVPAIGFLNSIHSDTIKIWDVSVTSRAILYLTDDRVNRASCFRSGTVEVFARCPV